MTLTARTIKTNSLTAAGTSGAATDALGSSATLLLAQGSQAALAVISGTFSATLQFEAQASGGTWFAAPAVPVSTTGAALVSSATAAGNFIILAAGALQVRVRCSAYTSGTAVVELSNAPVGGVSYNVASPSGITDVQGPNADGGALSNPVQVGIYESSTVIRDLHALNAPAADLQAGKGVAAANPTGQLKSGTITQSDTLTVASDARGSAVTLTQPGGASGCGFYITGNTGGSTLQFEGSVDGSNWFSLNAINLGTTGSVNGLSTVVSSGQFLCDIGGVQQVRIRCSTYVSGTPTITLFATVGSGSGAGIRPVFLASPGGSTVGQFTPGDAQSNSISSIAVGTFTQDYDDISGQWNRRRNNTIQTAFASAARTSTPTAVNITNWNARGLVLFVDVTVAASALALTPSITLRDTLGATAFTLWTAAAQITATGAARYVYLLYPGSASAGSWTESVQIALPRQLTINMTHANANSVTYSVTVHHIL